LALTTTLVDPLGDRPVPFTQLASLGGGRSMPGLRSGRLSTAIGLETSGSRDTVFQAIVGLGTETIESGADLDAIRFSLGVRSGF
jgi:hypothetical protein